MAKINGEKIKALWANVGAKIKVAEKMKEGFSQVCDELVLCYISPEEVGMFTVVKGEQFQVKNVQWNEKKGEDELFPFDYLSDCCDYLKPQQGVIFLFAKDMCLVKELILPEVEPKELPKMVDWELKNLELFRNTNYKARKDDHGWQVEIYALKDDVVKAYESLIKNSTATLLDMVVADSADNEGNNLIMAKDLLAPEESALWQKVLGNALSSKKISIYDSAQPLSKIKWGKVYAMAMSLLMVCTVIWGGYWFIALHSLQRKNVEAKAQVELLSKDLALAQEVEQLEQQVKVKEKQLAKLREQNVPLYALIQELAAIKVNGVALRKVAYGENKFMITGEALSYTALNEYKEEVAAVKNMKLKEDVAAEKIKEQNGLQFLMEGDVVGGEAKGENK